MKDYFINDKKGKELNLQEQILKDAYEYQKIAILCLGPSIDAPSPFLTFASKVGTILKTNHFWVYGDTNNPIRIDKNEIVPIQREIDSHFPNTFTLVIVNSISDSKKVLGNIHYESTPFQNKTILVGNATLTLFGSFGHNEEEYLKNGLSLMETNEIATDVALLLMAILKEKKESNDSKLQLEKRNF